MEPSYFKPTFEKDPCDGCVVAPTKPRPARIATVSAKQNDAKQHGTASTRVLVPTSFLRERVEVLFEVQIGSNKI